jgi:hypothetical protein
VKSNRQRRGEILAKRDIAKARTIAKDRRDETRAREEKLKGRARVNLAALGPSIRSYTVPKFVQLGYYEDMPFKCKDCGKDQVCTRTQQRWWYEVAKGDVHTVAIRCRPCRALDRVRASEARRVHLEGVARKPAR